MNKKVLPVVLGFGLALGLVGCSSAPENNAVDCRPEADQTAAVAKLVTNSEFGADSKIEIAAPVTVESSEHRVVAKGTGKEAKIGDTVLFGYSLYNGTTGEFLEGTGIENENPVMLKLDTQTLPGIVATINCATEGSRILAITPSEDAFGAEVNEQIGLSSDDDLVWLIQLSRVVGDRADGVDQEVSAELPKVTLDADGKPTVTIPGSDAPKELTIGVLKKGSGTVVPEESQVLLQYQGVNWRTGEVFDQSWGRGIANFELQRLVPGFTQAVAGQTIGSQIVVVIPPELGYGPNGGNSQAGIAADDTLVFVIDILAAY